MCDIFLNPFQMTWMVENKLKYPFTVYPVIMSVINCNIALVLIWVSVMV